MKLPQSTHWSSLLQPQQLELTSMDPEMIGEISYRQVFDNQTHKGLMLVCL